MHLRSPDGRLAWVLLLSLALLMGLAPAAASAEAPEPPTGLAPVKPAVPMPVFSLPALQGQAFEASTLKNKVVVVRFWATW